MIKTLNKTSEDMIPSSTCKSPRHKIEEARTKTREETKKNKLLSSTAPDISSETPNKPLDTSCTLLKKGSRNKCAPATGVHRTKHQVRHSGKTATCLARSTRHQTCLVYHQIPHRTGYSERVTEGIETTIMHQMCPV
jgi:hypothetical protein